MIQLYGAVYIYKTKVRRLSPLRFDVLLSPSNAHDAIVLNDAQSSHAGLHCFVADQRAAVISRQYDHAKFKFDSV